MATTKCKSCFVGMIGSRKVFEHEWDVAEAEFKLLIEDWNEKTKRFAVPHPGYVNKFNHCPVCGHKVSNGN